MWYSLIKTLFYVSFFTFLCMVAAELWRPGFVVYFMNLPAFFLLVLGSGIALVVLGKK